MRLFGKNIVVTGATGIAAAGAVHMAKHGATLYLISRDSEECERLAAEIRASEGSVEWTAADLTIESETERAFAQVGDRFDRVDGLFAVAGGSGRRFGDGPADEVSLEGWERTFEINGHPAFLATRSALMKMKGQRRNEEGSRGAIVLVSSVLADHPSPDLFATHAYAAVKGAINSLTRAVAAYHAADGIRVNAIAPGLVETPMSERASSDPATVDYAGRKQPLARGFLKPSHIADTALFLLSDESLQITGQVIAVDGGWSITDAGV